MWQNDSLLINFHTHHALPGEWAVQNFSSDFEKACQTAHCSLGIHPWYIKNGWQQELEMLTKYAAHQNVVAIGECGLDRVCPIAFELQKEVFTLQAALASSLNKPLILHCVRAFEETFDVLKTVQVLVPVIFHGFNRNVALARKIVEHGYYLSFGASLQHDKIKNVLQSVPLHRVVFETDDSPVPITTVYQWAAEALQVDMKALSLQIKNNTQTIIGKNLYE